MGKYVLLVATGDLKREVTVTDETMLVGRGPECGLRLPDDYCSRIHAKIVPRDGGLYVEDVGARNGIFVNGERVLLDQKLSDGDEIKLGRTSMRVRLGTAAPAPSQAPKDLTDTQTKEIGPEGVQFLDPAREMGFHLTRLVAVSGMGLLFDAQDVRSERRVAFKILRPDRATESNVARAVEEAKSLARIRHENIVSILSTGRLKNGESFLVMDYVDGLTATQLGKSGKLGIPEALKIASDTCNALQVVHERGMVHRDIKPSNIMIESKSARTVLIDFSLALTEGGGLAGAPAGTIIFCAPEQVQPRNSADTMSPLVDIYGLGGTLYFMLTGSHPFRGSSTLEIQNLKLNQAPPLACAKFKDIHPRLDEILTQSLQADPTKRFATAVDLRKEIDKVRGMYPKSSGGKRGIPWAPIPAHKRAKG
ncbi:MAG: protein kinase domain-containing protein [Planctomycetaceae bacterium]